MKRIAIFCDGTWNTLSGLKTTHVAALARAVTPTAADGVKQLVFYQKGVGTGRGSNKIARFTDRVLGGMFGWGLDDNVIEAYRNLALWYEVGDEIFIFGFSRGAYTARSLAGLIRTAGIPLRQNLDQLKCAMRVYRDRSAESHPDHESVMAFRRGFAPLTATSEKDLRRRRECNDNKSFQLTLAYMGVWDTVGALGLPELFGPVSRLLNKNYAFHDAELSSLVRAARHAVAIDERRRHFPPSLWSNLDTLNGVEVTGKERPYQQMWFPGVHSVVGGSAGVDKMSSFTADWIVAGARDRKLEFDRNMLRAITGDQDAAVEIGHTLNKAGPGGLLKWLLADRKGPSSIGDVSNAARERVVKRPDYRPGALSKVLNDIL